MIENYDNHVRENYETHVHTRALNVKQNNNNKRWDMM